MQKFVALNSNWDQIKEKIKETNPEISDADLVLNHGNEDEVFETLAKKLGKSTSEVKQWIESVSANKVIAG